MNAYSSEALLMWSLPEAMAVGELYVLLRGSQNSGVNYMTINELMIIATYVCCLSINVSPALTQCR